MPGTIKVSVLEFKDLPSSIPPSSMLTKVTMGKREYQTRDKGDFSFPLTALRDNVTITIQDTEGNEMSQTVVQIMSVVERGSWDEFISLEGGGNVRMRLQFVLSEDERNQVRTMRESAMKKKSDELLSKSLRRTETASTTGDTVTSSLGINHEVSDSKRSVAHSQALSIGDPPMRVGDGGTSFDERQIEPNDTDESEETSLAASMSKSLELDLGVLSRKSKQNIETKLQQVGLPKRPVLLQEPTSATKKSLVSSKLKMFQADQPEKQDPLGKTPSNVRKMISAFESSLAKDIRPGIKPPPAVKLQSKDPKLEDLARPRKTTSEMLKKPSLFGESQRIQKYEMKREEHIGFGKDYNGDQISEVIRKPVKLTSEMLKNPSVIGESQQIQPYKAKKEEHIASDIDLNWCKWSQDAGQLEEPSTTHIRVKENESVTKPKGGLGRSGEVQQIHTYKAKREEYFGFDEDLNRSKSSLDTRQLKEPSIAHIQVEETKSIVENESRKSPNDLEGTSAVEAATVVERHGSGICSTYSNRIDIQGVSEDKLESATLFENEDFTCESSDAWIFPDHVRRLCITTGSIEVESGLVEGFRIQERTPEGRNCFSLPEHVEKPNIQPGDCDVLNNGDEISDELRTTQLDNSAQVESSNGPLGQAVKVAIMVAFGVLVFFTRQRKHR
ncbi:uncharacterized protein LOC131320075 isoform X2 [Rhododendron vialii]|uniref:uncharacterized protein LOC131320075 isoform X2 n=1 Tax=Rhododendron vialii TaxID=182163 RepID=UPI00265F3334|nr:uncharacterized protein LOC131320075 isoform X2 [Rhododendron vialii]